MKPIDRVAHARTRMRQRRAFFWLVLTCAAALILYVWINVERHRFAALSVEAAGGSGAAR